MLKLIVDTKNPENVKCELKAHGEAVDIFNDLVYGLGVFYSRVKSKGPEDAAEFRRLLTLAADDPQSPLWTFNPPPEEFDSVEVDDEEG